MVDSAGEVRAAWGVEAEGEVKVWWRAPGAKVWNTSRSTTSRLEFLPLGVDRDPRYLWVSDFQQGDSTAISRFDTVTTERTVVVHRPGLDPTRLIVLGASERSIAVRFDQLPDAPLVALSADYAPGLARLQSAFPGFLIDPLDVSPAERKTWLVGVSNSRVPGTYLLFNAESGKSDLICQTHGASLPQDVLVAADYLSVTAPGGRKLTGFLWRPRDTPRPPLVVLVPAQLPRLPATNAFSAEVQALVASGYAVLSINGRGTIGFGHAQTLAAERELALIVREDCEHMIAVLGRDGVVDERRVTAMGYGLGGAFALQLAATSRAFSSVINVDGPPELTRESLASLSVERDRSRLNARFGGWRQAAQFAQELSVLTNAVRCQVPALHLYSNHREKMNDHGRKVLKAVGEAGVPAKVDLAYPWSEYLKPVTQSAREQAALIGRVVAFLDGVKPIAKSAAETSRTPLPRR